MIPDDTMKQWRALAEKATPGPYCHSDDIDSFGPVCDFAEMRIIAVCAPSEKKEFSAEQIHANQCFIAAFSPSTAIALLDEVERWRKGHEILNQALGESTDREDDEIKLRVALGKERAALRTKLGKAREALSMVTQCEGVVACEVARAALAEIDGGAS